MGTGRKNKAVPSLAKRLAAGDVRPNRKPPPPPTTPTPRAMLDAMRKGSARPLGADPAVAASAARDPADSPLAIAASAAVPLRIAEYRARGGPSGEDFRRCREVYSQLLAEKGDVLQYRGKKQGESAAVFNALVDGLAVMAFCPGGVKFCGTRYQAEEQR